MYVFIFRNLLETKEELLRLEHNLFYKNPKDYSFVWHWLNKKRSLNGTLVFKADFDQIPDLNALRLSMKKLSEKYPTLKSTIQLSGSYKIYLARNEEDNIIISNQEFDDLESFTEHEVNVDFVPGKRLYYVKLAKLKLVAMAYLSTHITSLVTPLFTLP